MFDVLELAPPDAILGLNEAFQKDSNPEKINLGVGVYKDEGGVTPILNCVKKAERKLLEQQKTKAYLGIDGNQATVPRFQLVMNHGVRRLVEGEREDEERDRGDPDEEAVAGHARILVRRAGGFPR